LSTSNDDLKTKISREIRKEFGQDIGAEDFLPDREE
jgi:hypothetical protein